MLETKEATYGKRMHAKIDKHLALGKSRADAVVCAMQECNEEDVADSERSSDDADDETKAKKPADDAQDEPDDQDNDSESDDDADDDQPDDHKKALTLEAEFYGVKRTIPQDVRDKIPDADFADPAHHAFFIVKPIDVHNAARSIGRGQIAPDALKARIIAIAYRKGAAFVAQLPDDWKRKDDQKSVAEKLASGLRELLSSKSVKTDGTGFKVVGDHWLAVWSNNFKDRTDEIFTAKAQDAYVRRVDLGLVPPPELWDSHIPGTKSGQAEWVARHGHFMIALGTFDDTPKGRAAKAYYAKRGKEQSISHGFKFPVKRFVDGVYHAFNTFEVSPLDRGAEANRFTSWEGIKEMTLTAGKKKRLVAVFGKDLADQILADLDEKGKALEDLNVQFKEFSDVDDKSDDDDVDVETLSLDDLKELLPDLVEGQAEAVKSALEALKGHKALEKRLAKLEKAFAQRPKRASESKETELDEDDEDDKEIIDQIKRENADAKATKAFPGLYDHKSGIDQIARNQFGGSKTRQDAAPEEDEE